MYTNISNIIDMLILIIGTHKNKIDAIIHEYQNGCMLNIFKGIRKTLPLEQFPSLELEPVSGNNRWNTVYTQNPSYSVDMVLTVNTDNDDIGVEYIGTITQMILEILNNPSNMNVEIPRETSYVPNYGYLPNRIQDAFVDNVSYNATKDGTIRVARWQWTCKTLEGFNPTWRDKADYEEIDGNPIQLPPVPEIPQ